MMTLTIQQVVFYVFAGLTVLSAIMVVTQANPVRCVLFLVFCFFTSSVLWMMVQAEFLALVLVLVYVGAVMTLFLFVVMMLNIEVEVLKTHLLRWLPVGLLMTAALVGLLYVSLPDGLFNTDALRATQQAITQSDTQAIGMVLYTRYLLAFELAAVLLLVAIIAAITLVHRPAIGTKRQSIRDQIMVDPKDRLTLVSMSVERCKE